MYKSKLQSIKNLEERNAAFEALSDEDKRKEIAWDCFQLTLSGKVSAGWGYWSDNLIEITAKTPKSFQNKLVKKLPECEVCARGGMMLSQIRLGNTLSCDSRDSEQGNIEILQGFSMNSFEIMEGVYEGYTCITMGRVYPYQIHTTELLQNICLNVIHNGDFNINDATDYLQVYNTELKQA
jgi:hypothetical protein